MTEPVSLEQARMHLRLDVSGDPPANDEDALVSTLIVAARRHAERITGRTLVQTNLSAYWDAWRPELALPASPVQSITAVKYVADDGTLTTLDSGLYRADLVSLPARITPAYGACWPYARSVTNAIQVDYVAGPTGDVEEGIVAAMLIAIAHWFEQRSTAAELPAAVGELLALYRIFWAM